MPMILFCSDRTNLQEFTQFRNTELPVTPLHLLQKITSKITNQNVSFLLKIIITEHSNNL